jgi:hypothetical protein
MIALLSKTVDTPADDCSPLIELVSKLLMKLKVPDDIIAKVKEAIMSARDKTTPEPLPMTEEKPKMDLNALLK